MSKGRCSGLGAVVAGERGREALLEKSRRSGGGCTVTEDDTTQNDLGLRKIC